MSTDAQVRPQFPPEIQPENAVEEILGTIGVWHRNAIPDDHAMIWSQATGKRLGFLPRDWIDGMRAGQQVFPAVLANIITDLYVTPNALFKGWACEALLKRFNACWVDVDSYRMGLSGLDAWKCLQAEDWFHEHHIPEPSQVISSGRGLYLIWLLDGSPDAFKRIRWVWEKVQGRLCAELGELGADAASKNGSRVLRPVGSVNGKVDIPVELLHDTGVEYTLGELAYAVGVEIPPEHGPRKRGRPGHKVEHLKVRWHPSRFGPWSTNHNRLVDLASLNDRRGGFKVGHRDLALFYYCSTLKALGRSDGEIDVEAHSFNDGFNPPLRSTDVEKVVRYIQKQSRAITPRSRTIIQALGIGGIEQSQLTAIIGPVEKENRKRVALQSTDTGRRVLAIFDENPGITQMTIRDMLHVSQATVSRVLMGAHRNPYSRRGRPRKTPTANPLFMRAGNYSL